MSLFHIKPLVYAFSDDERDTVESSNIDKAKYCPNTYTLVVKFAGGGVYLYSSIPHSVGRKFFCAESKGKYLSKHIIGAYPFIKINKDQ